MAVTPNQFQQAPVTGQMDMTVEGNSISVQVSLSQTGTIVAGDKVKLEDSSGGVPKVLKVDANSDNVFGTVIANRKDQSFAAGDAMEVAIDGSLIYQVAGAAVARGAQLEVVASTQKVITNAGTNPVYGFAFDKAAADGDLIRVYVQSLEQNVAGSYPFVQNINVTATLAEINAGKTIIPAVTGKQIRVVDYVATVAGTFTTTTSVDLQDESATNVTALAQADLSDGAILLPSDGTLGAGFAAPLTSGEALQVVNTGTAAAGGTSITFNVSYLLV